jgi:tRNA(Ile2) C34 agmatinyltransferase TiaS
MDEHNAAGAGRDPADVDPDHDAIMQRERPQHRPPVCPDCGGELHYTTGSTLVCTTCGYISEPDR